MPATPKRAGRAARPGSRFVSEVLAANVRDTRSLRRLSQDELAARMRALGHEQWSRATVSEIERGGRTVTVDELAGLTIVFAVTPGDLLDPTGVDHRGRLGLDHAAGADPLPALAGSAWAHGKLLLALQWDDGPGGASIEPAPQPDLAYSTGAMAALEQWGIRVRHDADDEGRSGQP